MGKKVPLALGLAVILGICGVLVFANARMHKKRAELATQVASLENKIQDMQNKNDELKKGIAKSADEQYIEKVAREELDLQKPGEKVYSFIMPEKSEENADQSKKNFLQNWLGWLSNLLK